MGYFALLFLFIGIGNLIGMAASEEYAKQLEIKMGYSRGKLALMMVGFIALGLLCVYILRHTPSHSPHS